MLSLKQTCPEYAAVVATQALKEETKKPKEMKEILTDTRRNY